jgi:hypothetical protein
MNLLEWYFNMLKKLLQIIDYQCVARSKKVGGLHFGFWPPNTLTIKVVFLKV